MEEQNLDLQRQALEGAGCDNIFEDRVSGAAIGHCTVRKSLLGMWYYNTILGKARYQNTFSGTTKIGLISRHNKKACM